MTAVEAIGLSAGYGKVRVLKNVDLAVQPGEVVALLGRNGAGKTTTLLTLAGFLVPTEGMVRLAGSQTTASLQERVRQGMALVTDDRAVFFGLTVRENLRLGRGTEQAAIREFPELQELLDRPAGLLSGGQQQMLAVGRALAAKPDVLLVDELSLGLAPVIVQRLLVSLRAAADGGAAVLLVEQYARLVLDVVDRAYLMVNGRVAVEGTRAEFQRDLSQLERHYFASTT